MDLQRAGELVRAAGTQMRDNFKKIVPYITWGVAGVIFTGIVVYKAADLKYNFSGPPSYAATPGGSLPGARTPATHTPGPCDPKIVRIKLKRGAQETQEFNPNGCAAYGTATKNEFDVEGPFGANRVTSGPWGNHKKIWYEAKLPEGINEAEGQFILCPTPKADPSDGWQCDPPGGKVGRHASGG